MSAELVLRLPAGLDKATAAARRSLRAFEGFLDHELLESLELLVSELITNSLRHAHLGPEGWVELRVTAEPARARAEVVDPGPGFAATPVRDGQLDQGSGWGLYLVDRIASDWGASNDGEAKVWFVLTGEEPGARRP